jgi:ubiquitin thioesterase OTU1
MHAGYSKQVMVIYNGVHYDALAVAASPRADQDEDVTEYNPRTRRGKMILAAAQELVRMCAGLVGW